MPKTGKVEEGGPNTRTFPFSPASILHITLYYIILLLGLSKDKGGPDAGAFHFLIYY